MNNLVSLCNEQETSVITHESITAINTTYIIAATSDNTRLAYQKDIRHFRQWGGVLPTTAAVIVNYLHQFAETLNARTLSRRLTALKNWHVFQVFNDPTSHSLVRKTLTGIKNVHGQPKVKAPALQLDDLSKMVTYLTSRGDLIDLRNNALLQIGFFGAFRRSELVAIQFEDLHFVAEGVEIIVPRSKTDQSREGQVVAIPYGTSELCPVKALKTWCEVAIISRGSIFRRVTKNDTVLSDAIAGISISSSSQLQTRVNFQKLRITAATVFAEVLQQLLAKRVLHLEQSCAKAAGAMKVRCWDILKKGSDLKLMQQELY